MRKIRVFIARFLYNYLAAPFLRFIYWVYPISNGLNFGLWLDEENPSKIRMALAWASTPPKEMERYSVTLSIEQWRAMVAEIETQYLWKTK